MNRLRIAWGDLLPSGNHSEAYGFELYCRLFDHYQAFDEEVAAAEHPKSLLKRIGLDITQGDIRALGGVPGIFIEGDQPDTELIHIHGRVALDLLSNRRLAGRSSVFAQFLWTHEYPTLSSIWDPDVEESGIGDFITRSSLMRVIAQTNQARGSLDWNAEDVSKEEYKAIPQESMYKGSVQGWAKRAAKRKGSAV